MRWGGAGPRTPWGGDGVAGAPPLARLAACPWGILRPDFSNSMPGRSAFKGEISYVLSRERHLARQRGDLRPRAMSWPVTRTSVIPIVISGAAPGRT